MRNLRCLLPAHYIVVIERWPHPCGGYFTQVEWCWGPNGPVGYYVDGDS